MKAKKVNPFQILVIILVATFAAYLFVISQNSVAQLPIVKAAPG